MKRPNGFTIVELLISLAIFSLVIVIVYSSFFLGVKAWRQNEADLNAYQIADYCFSKIKKDFGRIAGPVNSDSPGDGSSCLTGAANEVSFFILYPMKEYEEEGILEIKKVRYFLKDKTFMRQVVSGSTEKDEVTELAEDIEEIKLSYRSSEGAWANQWTDKKFPREVKIDLQLDKKISSKINSFTRAYSILISNGEGQNTNDEGRKTKDE